MLRGAHLVLVLACLGAGACSNPMHAQRSADRTTTPDVGACRDLTASDLNQQTNSSRVVGCDEPHTAVTFASGRLPRRTGASYADVRHSRFVFATCQKAFAAYIGADESLALRVRLSWAWFRPSERGWARGARWYRCDLVGGPTGATRLSELPADAHDVLSTGDPDTWLACAAGSTVARGTKVPCTAEHHDQARSARRRLPGRRGRRGADPQLLPGVGAQLAALPLRLPVRVHLVQAGPLGRGQPPLDLLGEDPAMRRSSRLPNLVLALLSVFLLAALLAGCAGGPAASKPPATSDSPSTSGPTSGPTTAAAPPASPQIGECYQLDVRSALKATSSRPAIPCARRHTSVTVSVGTVQPVVDGHLLAVGSSRVQRQIADSCRRTVDRYVGGSLSEQRLSRVQAVWFNPTPDQVDRGALWFRCDLVVSAGARSFAALPKRTKGLLEVAGALDRWGTCGTAAPSSKSFARVLCSARHTWRARTPYALPAGTTYLSKKAGKVADARCHHVAAALSPTSTTLRWAFEWPSRQQWTSVQRYGFCWTPDPPR